MRVHEFVAASLLVFSLSCAPTPQQLQADWEDSLHQAHKNAPTASEPIGMIDQALVGSHIVPISAGQQAITGWGIFGSGNPGPDGDGCQRLQWRNDCIRVNTGHTTHTSFNNELAYPNLIVGDFNNAQMYWDIDAAPACASAPSTINHISVLFTVYSSGGTQGTVNKVDVGETEPSGAFQTFAANIGPSANGQELVAPIASVFTTSTGAAIPKSAVCGTASQRWDFSITARADSFPNSGWDTSDWLAVGDVTMLAYW